MTNSSTTSGVHEATIDKTQAVVDRLLQHLKERAEPHLLEIAKVLASKADSELFGETEFEVRDILSNLGKTAFQAAIDERQKKGARIQRC